MQIYSKSMKNATSLFRNHNRSALEAGTYITHRVIYYPLVSYGLSFSRFARFPEFRGTINDKWMANPENDSP